MQNQKQYEVIFENHPEGIALFEIQSSKITNCNLAFAKSIGYTKEELIGQSVKLVYLNENTITHSNHSFQEKIAILHHTNRNGNLIDKEVRIKKINVDNNELLLCFDRMITNKTTLKNFPENDDILNVDNRYDSLNEFYQHQYAIDEHVMIAITNLSGKILYANEQCCKISKYSKEELLGKNYRILNSGYHDKNFWRNLYETISTGTTWFGEIRNKSKDGKYYWVATTIIPLKNTEGTVDKYLTITTDITEKKQIEESLSLHQIKLEQQNHELMTTKEELEIARSRYYDLYYLAPVGYITVSNKDLILEPNLSAAGMLGVSRNALSKQSISKFILNEDYHIYSMHCKLLNETGNPQSFELRLLKNDGTQFWVRLEATSVTVRNGLHHYFITIMDISKRKQIEDALKKSEARFHAIFDQAPLGIALIDSTSGNYIQINPKFATILGYSEQEIIGKHFLDITHPEDVKLSLNHWQSLSDEKNKLLSFEKRYIKKDRTIVWTNLTRVNFFYKDNFSNYHLVIIIDITESKKAKDILEKYNEELQRINKTKDKFFGIIAHDLRNPFAGILGLTEILDKKMQEEFMNETVKNYHKYVQMVQNSAQSAFNLLENLMQWARSQTGEISVRPKNTSLDFILSYTIPIVYGNAFKKNISIEKDLVENDIIFADESLVSTILRNLLTNSIKFTNQNGNIILSTKEKDKFLEISISDNGVGIDPESLEKIFKIETKFSRPGTENERGTGLGLILCKEFIEKQGGKIWINSILGTGTTITFSLPLGKI